MSNCFITSSNIIKNFDDRCNIAMCILYILAQKKSAHPRGQNMKYCSVRIRRVGILWRKSRVSRLLSLLHQCKPSKRSLWITFTPFFILMSSHCVSFVHVHATKQLKHCIHNTCTHCKKKEKIWFLFFNAFFK